MLLGFHRDPFSPSPDPDNFIATGQQQEALDRLEVAIRHRDGLGVVSGDVGTGKTTMSRILHSDMDQDRFISAILLDPMFNSEFQFLKKICSLFDMPQSDTIQYEQDCLNVIKSYLIEMNRNDKVITLIIDEGQDLKAKILRRIGYILNFELKVKLINVIIFAQLEFLEKVKRHERFRNRIETKYYLNSFSKTDALKIIRERILISGGDPDLFTQEALDLIVNHTDIPRSIIQLCRNALREMLLLEKKQVDGVIIERAIELSERF